MNQDTAATVERLAARLKNLSPDQVTRPVLVYFDIIGICWPIRCLLHLKQVDYELVKVPIQAWAYRTASGDQPLKKLLPNRHLPLYVDPDVRLTQSNVIATYLAEKHDLFGDSSSDRLRAMDVMAHAYDALFHWTGLFQVMIRANTPDDVVENRLRAFLGGGEWAFLGNGYHHNLSAFEQYLDANPERTSGFIVGSRLSMADLHAFNVLCNWYKAFDRDRFVEQYPRLDEYIRRIAAIPRINDYIRHHQERTLWFPLPQLAIRLTSPEEIAELT